MYYQLSCSQRDNDNQCLILPGLKCNPLRRKLPTFYPSIYLAQLGLGFQKFLGHW